MELLKEEIEITDSNGNSVKTTGTKMRQAAKQLKMNGEGFEPIRTNFDEAKMDEKFRSHKKQVMNSQEMRKLAEAVMEEQDIQIGPASVGCLLIYPNISKKRAAKVSKENDISRHFSGYDYLIQVSGELWDMLDTDTKKMLLYHSLMQIEPQYKSKEGIWKFNLRKPDFSDFYRINDKHGNNWYKAIQATVSSLYDLDPREENNVQV